MIKQIRIDWGYNSISAFSGDIGINQSRYYNIERMHIKATHEEFKLICGDKVGDYDEYCLEFEAKKTLMFTARMENFAAFCGDKTPCETVRRYFADNRY